MKSIIFVRHAKSSWDSLSLDDHDRPLNERGKRDSKFMSKKLKELNWVPDLIITSSAKRATKTANEFEKTLNITNVNILQELYLAPPYIFMQNINKIDAKYQKVMMVAHNPAMTDLVNMFSMEMIFNVPTCGIFKVDFNIDNWDELSFEESSSFDFIYPKMFTNEF